MLTKNINFKNFLLKKKNYNIRKIFKDLKKNYFKGDEKLLSSLSENYQYSFKKNLIRKYKNYSNFRIIGMGGSILGAQSIYNFLNRKIKKNFFFINNLKTNLELKDKKKNFVNIIVSKSGNTLETICNSNIIIKNNKKNIIVTEINKNFLNNLAFKLKADIVEHKNYIGGRYSVLSEVGMLPAQLMGLKDKKFKRLNYLINNKIFFNQLINNVQSTLSLINKDKYISVILNYDEHSEDLFKWYQQLIAESLGKKSKGILPVISTMPKDNHSLMQYYLDGPKKSFYTFFSVIEKKTEKINNKFLFESHKYLKNKSVQKILETQILATQNVFKKKGIPFRKFEILNRTEETIGEIFCFFILETILLGKALKINPFDQPSVELIKKETKKIIFKS